MEAWRKWSKIRLIVKLLNILLYFTAFFGIKYCKQLLVLQIQNNILKKTAV